MFRLWQSRYQKPLIVCAALLVVGASFFAGALYGISKRPAIERIINVTGKENPEEFQSVDFGLFWDVWSRIETSFVDKDKIKRHDLVNGAISGIVRSLGDPYTEFLPPAETKQFQEDIKGSFDGIGAEIGIRKGILTIIAPLKDSPAEHAGIRAADKILKVNETATLDLALDEAVRLIRGPKGTEVTLTIFRDSFDKPKEIKVTRDTIKIVVLETEKKSDNIFVIKLHHFTENAASEFRRAVQEYYRSGAKKIILDVRNNPGGFLTVSVDIASWFIPAGEIVVRERHADGSEDLYRSSGYRLLENIPTVVLINEGSASASEIVAGALRDVRGVTLIGQKSFGKGSVQEVEPLKGGASLKITIAKWLTPNSNEINGKGLEPDIKIEISPKDAEDPKKDPIMDKALEVLKNL